MNVKDGETLGSVAIDAGASDFASFVGGIVENLNVHEFAGIIELRDGIDEALNYVALVEDRKLYGNLWPMQNRRGRGRNIFAIDVVLVEELVAMQAVRRQNKQYDEIRNHHGEIEGVGVIDAAERSIGELMPVLTKTRLMGQEQE